MAYKVFTSPLRYAGGKYWLADLLFSLMPSDTTTVLSPFFGGGAFEINAAARGYTVYGYDIDVNLVTFWNAFLSDPDGVYSEARGIIESNDDESLRKIKRSIRERDYKDVSPAEFYLLSHLSFNSLIYASSYVVGIERRNGEFYRANLGGRKILPYHKYYSLLSKLPITVEAFSFEESLTQHQDAFVYCDPPYIKAGPELYKHGDIDHERLAQLLKTYDDWACSYDAHDVVYDLYADCLIVKKEKASSFRINGRRKTDGEVLILSPSIAERYQHLYSSQLTLF